MADEYLRKALYNRSNPQFKIALNYYFAGDYKSAIPLLLKCRTSNALYLLARYNYNRPDYENMMK